MIKKTGDKWVSVKIRRALNDRMGEALKTEAAQREGLTNPSQFADVAIRELLKKMKPERMSHVNMHEDCVKIMDNKLERVGRIVAVYFKKTKSPWCDYCKEKDCIHVQYAWEIPVVRKILILQGQKSPPPARR